MAERITRPQRSGYELALGMSQGPEKPFLRYDAWLQYLTGAVELPFVFRWRYRRGHTRSHSELGS